MMTIEEVDLFEKLGFYNWFEELSQKYQCESSEILRNPDRKKIEKIIDDLGYCSSYSTESKIYNIPAKFSGINFYCNPELRRGLVWVILFAENLESDKKIGDKLISICRLIEIAKGEDSGAYKLSPRFRSYQELTEILFEVFKMYEKFKVAVYESKILDHPA